MIPKKYHTFQDGQVPAGKITAERLNKNWDNLYDMFDPTKVGISEDNVSQSSKILVSDRNYTGIRKITGTFEFSTFPTVPDASIPENKINIQNIITKQTLDENIPSDILRDSSEVSVSGDWTFGGSVVFSEPVQNLVVETVESLPESVTNGRILKYGDDLYLGKNNEWKKLYTTFEDFITIGAVVSSTLQINHVNNNSTQSYTQYIKMKEVTINESVVGTIKVWSVPTMAQSNQSGYIRFAINGNYVTSPMEVLGNEGTDCYAEIAVNLSAGDKIQVYGIVNQAGWTLYCNELMTYFDFAITAVGSLELKNPMAINKNVSWSGGI